MHKHLTTFEYIMHKRTVETSQTPPPPPEGAKYQADVQPSADAEGAGGDSFADAEKDGDSKKEKRGPQGRALPRNLHTLPSCLDWFLFSKKKRKPASSDSSTSRSQPTAIPDAPEQGDTVGVVEASADPEAGYEDAEAGSAQRRGSGRKLGAVVPLADEGLNGIEPWDDAPSEPVVPPVAPPPTTSGDSSLKESQVPKPASQIEGADAEPQDTTSNFIPDNPNRGVAATLGCGGSTSVDTEAPSAGTKI